MPGSYGQDWSSYQPDEPPTNGLAFAFLKVTEGLGYVNPRLEAQRAWAHSRGLVVGLYHYPHMANAVAAEVARFLQIAQPRQGEILCLDWEGYDAANAGLSHGVQAAYKDEWLHRLAAAMPGHRSGTYCNVDYLTHVDASGHFGDFLWIATAGRAAGQPGIQTPWLFHQYATTSVDQDYCSLSAADLARWASNIPNPPITPPGPVPTPLTEETEMIMVAPPRNPASPWAGDFVLFSDGRLEHIPEPADLQALQAAGVKGPVQISQVFFDALRAGK